MPNSNPIKMKDTGAYPDFIIPKKYANKTILITTATTLAKTGWELDLIHSLSLAGKPLDFDPDPDIVQAEIGTGKKIDGKKFALASIATRIKNGGSGPPPIVKYSITFATTDEPIDSEFSVTSDETNPVTFYTKITFKLEK